MAALCHRGPLQLLKSLRLKCWRRGVSILYEIAPQLQHSVRSFYVNLTITTRIVFIQYIFCNLTFQLSPPRVQLIRVWPPDVVEARLHVEAENVPQVGQVIRVSNPEVLMTQQNNTDLTWRAHLPEGVWVYGEAEHVLKVEDVMEDRHMRTQVVDEFVRPEPELDIGVQVYELLEVVLSDLLTKIEFSRKSRYLNVPWCDVWAELLPKLHIVLRKFLCRKYLLNNLLEIKHRDKQFLSHWVSFLGQKCKKVHVFHPRASHQWTPLSNFLDWKINRFRLKTTFKFLTIQVWDCEHERSQCYNPPLYIVRSIQDPFPAISSPKNRNFEKLSWLQEWLSIIR